MIHEGPSRVAHEERSRSRRGAALCLRLQPRSRVRFSEHEFFSARTTTVQFIHPRRTTSPHGERGRKKYCAVNGLTCPCCSAAPPLLDCSPWTDSCCCIHSSVSLQKRRETEDEDSLLYFASDRSAKFLVGNNVGAPPSSFSAVQNVNAIQRDVVYILRNAYEIVLYG